MLQMFLFPFYTVDAYLSVRRFVCTKMTQKRALYSFLMDVLHMNNYKVEWNVFFFLFLFHYDEKQRPIFDWTFRFIYLHYDFSDDV